MTAARSRRTTSCISAGVPARAGRAAHPRPYSNAARPPIIGGGIAPTTQRHGPAMKPTHQPTPGPPPPRPPGERGLKKPLLTNLELTTPSSPGGWGGGWERRAGKVRARRHGTRSDP